MVQIASTINEILNFLKNPKSFGIFGSGFYIFFVFCIPNRNFPRFWSWKPNAPLPQFGFKNFPIKVSFQIYFPNFRMKDTFPYKIEKQAKGMTFIFSIWPWKNYKSMFTQLLNFTKISQMMTHFKSALEGEILETFLKRKELAESTFNAFSWFT